MFVKRAPLLAGLAIVLVGVAATATTKPVLQGCVATGWVFVKGPPPRCQFIGDGVPATVAKPHPPKPAS